MRFSSILQIIFFIVNQVKFRFADVCATYDFSKRCTQQPRSFYENGVCYSLLTTALTCAESMAKCKNDYKGSLAVLRSVDPAVWLSKETDQILSLAGNDYHTLIQKPNNDSGIYAQFNNTATSDGQHTMIVNQDDGPCLLVKSFLSMSPLLSIAPVDPPTSIHWALCQTLPTFVKNGCNQALNRGPCTVNSINNALTPTDCGIQCGMTTWCTGFNYFSANRTCEMLTENMYTQNLICDSGWDYYERL